MTVCRICHDCQGTIRGNHKCFKWAEKIILAKLDEMAVGGLIANRHIFARKIAEDLGFKVKGGGVSQVHLLYL